VKRNLLHTNACIVRDSGYSFLSSGFDVFSGRSSGNRITSQMDEDYIRALSYGMPPAGGMP